jgi:anti-anti-sigma regulatory factor
MFREIRPRVEKEAASVFAMVYFQTRKHIKLDLYSVDYLPLGFLTKLLNLARDLRSKKRVLILSGMSPSVLHFLQKFKLQNLIFLPSEGLTRSTEKRMPASKQDLSKSGQ